ncbi:MAG: helix-hairpin-helix domain-containing protein [Ruminococcus sp.]|jgi:competence protein ComEA
MRKKNRIWLLLIMALVLGGCGEEVVYQLEDTRTEEENNSFGEQEAEEPEELEKSTVVVHVCGAVVYPGVYELEAGSRAAQAVEAAGGLTEEACEESLNQAKLLSDGEQIRVLTKEEAQTGAVPADGAEAAGGRININTADAVQLSGLNGIGETKAAAILAYREEHGGFDRIEDICEVDGIGEKTFEKIKDSITVS